MSTKSLSKLKNKTSEKIKNLKTKTSKLAIVSKIIAKIVTSVIVIELGITASQIFIWLKKDVLIHNNLDLQRTHIENLIRTLVIDNSYREYIQPSLHRGYRLFFRESTISKFARKYKKYHNLVMNKIKFTILVYYLDHM